MDVKDVIVEELDANSLYTDKLKALRVTLPNGESTITYNPRDRMRLFKDVHITSTDVYKYHYNLDDYTVARMCCGYDTDEFDKIMSVKQKIKYLGVQYVRLDTVPVMPYTNCKIDGYECGQLMGTTKWFVKDVDNKRLLIFNEKPDGRRLRNAFDVQAREETAYAKAHNDIPE